jgi:WD40 repeat protein
VRIQHLKEKLSFIKKVSGIREGWDPCLQTLEGHSHYVNAVAFSPDGKVLASASNDTKCGSGMLRPEPGNGHSRVTAIGSKL